MGSSNQERTHKRSGESVASTHRAGVSLSLWTARNESQREVFPRDCAPSRADAVRSEHRRREDLLVVVGDVGVLAWRSRALLSDDVGCGTMGEIVVRQLEAHSIPLVDVGLPLSATSRLQHVCDSIGLVGVVDDPHPPTRAPAQVELIRAMMDYHPLAIYSLPHSTHLLCSRSAMFVDPPCLSWAAHTTS